MYYIIEKIELIDGGVNYTPIGYLESQEDVNAASEICTCFYDWCEANKEGLINETVILSDHFDSHGPSYVCNTITTDKGDLILITDTSILI